MNKNILYEKMAAKRSTRCCHNHSASQWCKWDATLSLGQGDKWFTTLVGSSYVSVSRHPCTTWRPYHKSKEWHVGEEWVCWKIIEGRNWGGGEISSMPGRHLPICLCSEPGLDVAGAEGCPGSWWRRLCLLAVSRSASLLFLYATQ